MAALFAAGAFGWILRGNIKRSNPGSEEIRSGLGKDGKSRPRLVARFADGSTQGVLQTDALSQELEIARESKFVKYLLKIGIAFLFVQTIVGVAYFLVLEKYVPYVYAAITGNTSIAAYNFAWLFAPFLALVALIWASATHLYLRSNRLSTQVQSEWASFLLMLSTAAALPLGETINDASRAPYMILTGLTGIPANDFANTAIQVTWPIAGAAILVGSVTIVFLLRTLYFVFSHGK